ncbi:hypothetical protein NDU88_005696 [Pleurodeles waltl]|uniref:Uncharacterized protein n=1 Tax=Pleurodeles waltl TaxID=8319 RepID=A0AAV7UKV3_PLEWA|nr:hypothetical protein NDU88_005696 [Pleurodeles waltl]
MAQHSKVFEAFKVLFDDGWEDLLQEGVLEKAWVGLKRPKSASSEGAAAAVMACASPAQSGKKYKQKSTSVPCSRFLSDRLLSVEGVSEADVVATAKSLVPREGLCLLHRNVWKEKGWRYK